MDAGCEWTPSTIISVCNPWFNQAAPNTPGSLCWKPVAALYKWVMCLAPWLTAVFAWSNVATVCPIEKMISFFIVFNVSVAPSTSGAYVIILISPFATSWNDFILSTVGRCTNWGCCAPTLCSEINGPSRCTPTISAAFVTSCCWVYLAIVWSARSILTVDCVIVVAKKDVVPSERSDSAKCCKPCSDASMASSPYPPWMWISINPGSICRFFTSIMSIVLCDDDGRKGHLPTSKIFPSLIWTYPLLIISFSVYTMPFVKTYSDMIEPFFSLNY